MLRVLMLGWELPPFISGGLGTACHGLTEAMSRLPLEVLFVLPKPLAPVADRSRGPKAPVPCQTVASPAFDPYAAGSMREPSRPAAHTAAAQTLRLGGKLRVLGTGAVAGYGGPLMQNIERFAQRCIELCADEPFDVIHAHDWMTFPAAERLSRLTGRPWVAHVHATEFDRSGIHVHQSIYDIERRGIHEAARVIAVSERTRSMLIEHYAAPEEQVQVIHNGVTPDDAPCYAPSLRSDVPVVLFLGRLTKQKGPGYFIEAAARVLERTRQVKFVVAGWGDLGPAMIERVAERGLSDKILFTGFLNGEDVTRVFQSASIYVMPSVSEPFGLTALEAVRGDAAVVLSRTTGVGEVLGDGAWTADYWDVDRLAGHVLTLLSDPAAAAALKQNGAARLADLSWDRPAAQCQALYHQALAETGPAETTPGPG
jgi:glycosyltransferase involved in cell wall biosynthesis